MTPLTIAAIKAVVTLGIDLAPFIQELVAKGQITAQQQADALKIYESLKARDAGQFDGPEWQVSAES